MTHRRAIVLVIGSALGVLRIAEAQSEAPRVLVLSEVLQGSEEHEIRWPLAVAAAAPERLAVADAYGPKLLHFRRVGVSWSLDRVVPLPATPVGLTWDGARYLVALRGDPRLVAVTTEDSDPLPMKLPSGIVPGPIASSLERNLFLYDAAASRVAELDDGLRVVSSTEVPGTVTGLTLLDAGGFLATIGEQGVVLRFDRQGAVLDSWTLPSANGVPPWPAGIAADPGGSIYVTDRHGGRILQLDHTGRWTGFGSRQGWDPGLLRFPAGLTLLSPSSLVVADQGNGRAQVFRLSSDRSAP